jgi:hypothetical protein
MRTDLADADKRLVAHPTKMRFQRLKSHQDALPTSFANKLPAPAQGPALREK